MLRILLNTTVLNKGGALQTSSNFIVQVLRNPTEFTWHLAVSPQVAKEVESMGVTLPPGTEVFPRSPARDRAMRVKLRAWAEQLNPDAVFTFSGPAYVKFRQPHLVGCSEGWVTHAGWKAYRALDFPWQWITFGLTSIYKYIWFHSADMWVMQTELSRQGLHRRLRIPLDKIHVISNSCGARYFDYAESVRSFPARGQKVRLFCFAAPYKHKNLQLLPSVAVELQTLEPELDFEIVVTLPLDGPDWAALQAAAKRQGVTHRLVNHGPVAVQAGPDLYRTCDLLLLPTVLEVFSATYPEAMAMGLPIVTSDLNFARDICGDAALYFPPYDARAAALQVQTLLRDPQLWATLIARGKLQLKKLPEPGERSAAYLELLRKLVGERQR